MSEHQTLASIPLDKAYLCADCHCVGNRSETCVDCGSGSLIMLAGILNRETDTPVTVTPIVPAAPGVFIESLVENAELLK